MIVAPHVLYEIHDRETGHILYCYPQRPLNLARMFTPGARTDQGYLIKVKGKVIAEVTTGGSIEEMST